MTKLRNCKLQDGETQTIYYSKDQIPLEKWLKTARLAKEDAAIKGFDYKRTEA